MEEKSPIDRIISEPPKTNDEYISIFDYAQMHNISTSDLIDDILTGKYSTALMTINRNEPCVTKKSTILKGSITSEDYISAKEYAVLHNLSYPVLLRKMKNGIYKTAVQNSSNHYWYIHKDEQVDGCRIGYIAASEYAKLHKMNYSNLLRMIHDGYFASAYQDSGKRWYIKESDIKTKPVFDDPEFEGYIPLKEFAEKKGVCYGMICEDVRNGLYADVIKKRKGHFIYIKKNAKCITDKRGVRGYISLKKYAEKNEVDLAVLRQDVKNGLYNTAKKIKNKWYLKPQEKCHSYSGMSNYISLTEYAKMYGVSRQQLMADFKAGIYDTVIKHNKHWYIDKNEELKSSDSPIEEIKENYITASEYAVRHNVQRVKVLADIKSGYYESAEFIGSKWYIGADEPCKTLSDDYISLTAYAKLHGISRLRLREDFENGIYTTVIRKGTHSYIHKDEEFKSFDRRKKEQPPNFISAHEYAKQQNFSYIKILVDVKKGLYDTAYQQGSHWFIDSNEPCKSVDGRKKKRLISVSEYANTHNISYQKMLMDVKKGLYPSAVKQGSRWFVDESEPVKIMRRKAK